MRLVAGLFVGVYVARYLGPDQFGILTYALTITEIFSIAAKLGMDSIVVRDLIKQPEQRYTLLGTAFILKFISSSVIIVCVAFFFFFIDSKLVTNIYVFIITMGLIFQTFEIVDCYFQSIVQTKYIATCKIVQLIVSSLIKIILIFAKADLIWFVISVLVDHATLAGSYFYVSSKKGLFWLKYKLCLENNKYQNETILNGFSISKSKSLISDSWPLLIYSLAVMLNMKSDIFFIRWMLGYEYAGVYSAATRLSSVLYIIPVVIGSGVFPYLAKNHSKDRFNERTKQLLGMLTIIATILAIGAIFTGETVLQILYGAAYSKAGDVFVIHVFGAIFVFHVSIRTHLLTIENKQKLSLYLLIGTLISNILLNIILIPLYGISGAAWASLLSWAANVLFFPLFSKYSSRYIIVFFSSPVFFIKRGFGYA